MRAEPFNLIWRFNRQADSINKSPKIIIANSPQLPNSGQQPGANIIRRLISQFPVLSLSTVVVRIDNLVVIISCGGKSRHSSIRLVRSLCNCCSIGHRHPSSVNRQPSKSRPCNNSSSVTNSDTIRHDTTRYDRTHTQKS